MPCLVVQTSPRRARAQRPKGAHAVFVTCPQANVLTQTLLVLEHLPKDGCDHHLAFLSKTLRADIPPPWPTRDHGDPPMDWQSPAQLLHRWRL